MRGKRDAPAWAGPPDARRACPICGKPASPEHRPFCSRRCADVDLHRWLGGRYAIPGPAAPTSGTEGADES